jgi:FAD:protein FMN transferase
MRRLLSFLVAVASCAACAGAQRPEASSPRLLDLKLRRLDGSSYDPSELIGRVVLLDVWATWCKPCKTSMPFYGRLQRELAGEGFTVIAVSTDQDEGAVRDFVREEALPFVILRDPEGRVPEALGVRGMPTCFLFDREGRLRWSHEGFEPHDPERIEEQVRALLGGVSAETSRERRLMGTLFRVTVSGASGPAVEGAIDDVFRAFEHVDAVMSEWKPDSAVSAVNRSAGVAPLAVPEELFDLLEISKRVSDETDGTFDVTWAALWGLWRFDGQAHPPDPAEIEARRALVSWRSLSLDPGSKTAFLEKPRMAIGLGAIAKGYALSLGQALLVRRGYRDFLLSAGGQVYAGGRPSARRAWRIGVQNPRGPPGSHFAIVELANESVSTSGDYERYFEDSGVRYHHIIDPRTGYPARGTRSATVVAADPTIADAYSTACFVLGANRALDLAKRKGFDLLLVDERGELHMTDGMRARAKMISGRPDGG